ncbi:unnamed protein product, partial [Ectocarpus sp. 12 AP-2014]
MFADILHSGGSNRRSDGCYRKPTTPAGVHIVWFKSHHLPPCIGKSSKHVCSLSAASQSPYLMTVEQADCGTMVETWRRPYSSMTNIVIGLCSAAHEHLGWRQAVGSAPTARPGTMWAKVQARKTIWLLRTYASSYVV